MWQTLLSNYGTGEAPSSVLWPIYFCNVIRFLLLFISIINKESKLFKTLAPFISYAAIMGGIVTFFDYQYPFYNDARIYSFERLKSTISHALMMVGGIYLFVGGYIKIRLKNIFNYLYDIVICGFVGALLNYGFIHFNINTNINAMWLRESALGDVEFMNGAMLGLLTFILVFLIALVGEIIISKKNKIKSLLFFKESKEWFKNLKSNLKDKNYLTHFIIRILFIVISLSMIIHQMVFMVL